ncbi:MAG TPA: glycosyltransferase family 1 protein [Candidatus Acidoferrales bacterium]|nr:glycosyltransferase family 1 protein [Candidatus Acidoferrales bacterium]
MFDLTDVINYFRSARLPTGIQRVQIEVVEYAIRDASFEFSIACFTKEANYWIEIPRDLFAALSRLSIRDSADSAWRAVAETLEAAIANRAPFKFSLGAVLLNLGSSWWLQNYFLGVRSAKAKFNILYVPFIHDLIPLAMPDLCVAELRNNFEEWIESVFAHADFFLVNSQNTLADLQKAARRAGVACEAAVVTLDADFRTAPTVGGQQPWDKGASSVFSVLRWKSLTASRKGAVPPSVRTALQDLGLEHGRFVLFVSTIEPRKNHVLVFNAWLELLRRHGAEKCPKLVCVGQRGWLNGAAHACLAANGELVRHVAILSKVSDLVLGELYKGCICTLYPSLYEGWGLPVTESLCFRKVPVVSRVASLTEAGGAFAEYFDVNSESGFLEAVERMVFDSATRLRRERKIRAEFRPRTWRDIGAQIVKQLRCWSEQRTVRPQNGRSGDSIYPVPIETGLFYSLAGEVQGARGEYARRGEIFRNGAGWWWPEPWGCWIRGGGPATLAFTVADSGAAKLCVYVGLRGVQGREAVGVIRMSERQRIAVPLRSEEERTVAIMLDPGLERQREIALTFSCGAVADFRPSTNGRDFRVCGLGVKWFYVCREDDLKARIDLIETVRTEEAAWLGCKGESRARPVDYSLDRWSWDRPPSLPPQPASSAAAAPETDLGHPPQMARLAQGGVLGA